LGFTAALAAGIAPARLVRCTLWTTPGQLQPAAASPYTYQAPCSEHITRSSDLGVVAALEVQRLLKPGRVSAELRYTRGTTNIVSGYSCCVVKNRSIALIVGYGLAIRR
jgi:hypothetical protein